MMWQKTGQIVVAFASGSMRLNGMAGGTQGRVIGRERFFRDFPRPPLQILADAFSGRCSAARQLQAVHSACWRLALKFVIRVLITGCDARGTQFSRVIHTWHARQPEPSGHVDLCNLVETQPPRKYAKGRSVADRRQ
jgi:hypothetical protein